MRDDVDKKGGIGGGRHIGNRRGGAEDDFTAIPERVSGDGGSSRVRFQADEAKLRRLGQKPRSGHTVPAADIEDRAPGRREFPQPREHRIETEFKAGEEADRNL